MLCVCVGLCSGVVYVCGVYVLYVHVYMHRGHRKTLGVLFFHFPPYSFETSLSEPEVRLVANKLQRPPHAQLCLAFYTHAGDLNSGHYSYKPSALTWGATPQLSLGFL